MPKRKMKTRQFGNKVMRRWGAYGTREQADAVAHLRRTQRRNPYSTRIVHEDGEFVLYVRPRD